MIVRSFLQVDIGTVAFLDRENQCFVEPHIGFAVTQVISPLRMIKYLTINRAREFDDRQVEGSNLDMQREIWNFSIADKWQHISISVCLGVQYLLNSHLDFLRTLCRKRIEPQFVVVA